MKTIITARRDGLRHEVRGDGRHRIVDEASCTVTAWAEEWEVVAMGMRMGVTGKFGTAGIYNPMEFLERCTVR